MGAQLQVFQNNDFGQVRAVSIDGEPWFAGKDVAKALEYKNTAKAIRNHVDDEDKQFFKANGTDTLKIPNFGLYIINESGLYSLILSSKLPSARKFKRWVTSEVLPAIRRSGVYSLGKPSRELTTDDYIEAARMVVKCHYSKLKLVCDLLERGGFEIPRVEAQAKAEKSGNIPASVAGWMGGVTADDLIGCPTADAYRRYVEWCGENGCSCVPHVSFSRFVNCTFGTNTKSGRVGGKVCKVFTERG